MKNVLLDSDILLDFLEGREPFFKDSETILHLAATGVINAYTTPLILANVFYVLRRKIDALTLRNTLLEMLRYVPALSMNHSILENALKSPFADFEDALQYEAAVQSGKVDVILTRNIKDYKKSKLPVMTPATFLAQQ